MSQRGHILDDVWYMDYVTGALAAEPYRVLLDSHVELSADARERVAAMERFGGAVLEARQPDSALPFDADDILARDADVVADEGQEGAGGGAGIADDIPLPRALEAYLARRGEPLKWSFLGPGMRKSVIWRGDQGETLWLLRARPGVPIPHHGHSGSELTLVLKGSFWDADQQYLPGDLEEAYPGVEHDIRIGDEGECICLALTEGKLRFENPLLRALQVFTGL